MEGMVIQEVDLSPDVAADFTKEKTRRRHEGKMKDLVSSLDEKAIERMRDEFKKSPIGRELKKITMGTWDGIPHWIVKE